MTNVSYNRAVTGLLVVDPYNDFISEGGKIWPRIEAVAEANTCVPHMLEVLNAARKAQVRVFYVMHRRYRPGDYETWQYVAPFQRAAWSRKSFEYGTWGGEFRAEFVPEPGDVAAEHWCSSGFASTDLDLQLKKHGIHKLIVTGLIAHTCIEATVRFAAELSYDGTVVRDATADYSDETMHAALDINMPNYANAIVMTNEVVASIGSAAGCEEKILNFAPAVFGKRGMDTGRLSELMLPHCTLAALLPLMLSDMTLSWLLLPLISISVPAPSTQAGSTRGIESLVEKLCGLKASFPRGHEREIEVPDDILGNSTLLVLLQRKIHAARSQRRPPASRSSMQAAGDLQAEALMVAQHR